MLRARSLGLPQTIESTLVKDIHVPRINGRYWASIVLASIVGTNTGDLFAHESGLGILGGLPVLGAILLAAHLLERLDDSAHEAWYWLAIIAIRTGATNVADFLCGRRYLAMNRVTVCVALAVLIGALVWRVRARGVRSVPETNWKYWTAMLAAGVLGTAGGDAITGFFGAASGVGGIEASAVLALLLAGVLAAGRKIHWSSAIGYYWVTVCLARTTGTAVADMLAENHAIHIGLPACTALTTSSFLAVLILSSRPIWRRAASE